MALEEITFSCKAEGTLQTIPESWSHTGVVGSGDMEVLIRREELGGAVNFKVVTPVRGFDALWKKVLERFVMETNLGNASIRINDNNSTPYIVSARLKQALIEAKEGGGR